MSNTVYGSQRNSDSTDPLQVAWREVRSTFYPRFDRDGHWQVAQGRYTLDGDPATRINVIPYEEIF